MTLRNLVVVDLETTGLSPERHMIVEVAWWNLATDKHGRFVPPHDVSHALAFGDLPALEMNGYRERLADAPQYDGYEELYAELAGNTFAGSNPAFDTAFLRRVTFATPWHHRLADLAAYAAGAFALSPGEMPGLADVCERLGVHNPTAHTAEADVRATGQCFRQLLRNRRDDCIPTVGVHVEPHNGCVLR